MIAHLQNSKRILVLLFVLVFGASSVWANPENDKFACELTFRLYGGWVGYWEGDKLVVSWGEGNYAELTLAEYWSEEYDDYIRTDVQTLWIEHGSHVVLTWIGGGDQETCSFAVCYSNGNQIYYGEGLDGEFRYEFDVDCEAMPGTVFGIAASVSPAGSGTVTGTGEYHREETCTLRAVANAGYSFMSWTEAGEVVSSDSEYSFNVTRDRNLVANFTRPLSVTVSASPVGGGTVGGGGAYGYGEQCTLSAVANTGYQFMYWYDATGRVVSNDAEYTFTVTEDLSLTAAFAEDFNGDTTTQTIALVPGNNWFSTNLDIDLNDLKAALVDALPNSNITIRSRTQNTSYNPNNHNWSGSLAWDVTKMYVIWVSAGCEITLEDAPINPTEHPVTIGNGLNWIAYPLNESKLVREVFAGFAGNGDVVRSQTGNASYRNGRWSGSFYLEPGKGFIYKSAASGTRTFTFSSSPSSSPALDPSAF